jgi:hypothetical protein
MATVTGYTAARMQEIEDGTIVSATYDASGHLILTRHDGTQIDVGRTTAATTAQSGIVELATNAETQTGTDATRAVTPAGLASLPGYRVQTLTTPPLETDLQSAYPLGTSLMDVSGWTRGNGYGTVVTQNYSQWRCAQTFYAAVGGGSSPKMWVRHYNTSDGTGGWSAWTQAMLMVNLDPTAFTQATSRGNYPIGQSRLYYTAGSAGSWDFAALAPGEVITYLADDTNFFGRQVFTQHAGGSSTPVQWFRTANQSGGWTAWQKVITDPGGWTTYTPTWTTSTGLHLPSLGNATVACRAFKLGRKVDVQLAITFGSTTNFGASVTGSDNWNFSLPPAWPAARSTDDGLGYMEMWHDKYNFGIARVKLASTTAVGFGIQQAFTGSSSVTPTPDSDMGGDVDSISPWTWASGDIFRGNFSYESAA